MSMQDLLSVSKYPYFVLFARGYSVFTGLRYLLHTEQTYKGIYQTNPKAKPPTPEAIHLCKIVGVLLLACAGYAHVALQTSETVDQRAALYSIAAGTRSRL